MLTFTSPLAYLIKTTPANQRGPPVPLKTELTNMQNVKAIALATKLAAVANDTRADDNTRANAAGRLAAVCEKHGLTIADYIKPDPIAATKAAMQADNAAPKAEKPKAAKPAKPAAPKAEKPSKPSADESKRAADYAERVELIAKLRASVAAIYNGASLAVRTNPKRFALSVYSDLLASPKHRTTTDRVSARDESALREIIMRGDATGAFDPSAINLDAGIFSRLASISYIEAAPKSAKHPFRLAKAGAEHARLIVKRAA